MTPTVKSYFAGAGLLEIGLMQAKLEIIQSLEYDREACKTHRHNFNHGVLEEDITQMTVFSQEQSDIHAYAYPCTKYSTIADIHNARNGDDLFLHAFRHTALELPEAFVIENVPGMRKFKIVMECFTKMPYYYTTVFCPVDAANWLPQRRERLIILGTRKPFSFSAPVMPKRKVRLKHIIEKDANPHFPSYIFDRINGKYRDTPIISDPEKNDIAPSCVAHYSKDRSTRLVKDKNHPNGVRPYTVREYARLQGVPDWFQFPVSDTNAYKQIGNGVAVPVGRWIGTELSKYFNKTTA
jgi:DNA (cytosine-5)-methyltransferase 1